MPVYAVEYAYSPDTVRRDAVRPAHRAHLAQLLDAGVLLASGPFGDDPAGALLVVRAADAAAAGRALDADPFLLEGLIETRRVRPWPQVFGPWTDLA